MLPASSPDRRPVPQIRIDNCLVKIETYDKIDPVNPNLVSAADAKSSAGRGTSGAMEKSLQALVCLFAAVRGRPAARILCW
jgi:hypothetical protein